MMRSRVADAVRNTTGLEIGGPTRLFGLKASLPLYAWAASIDNVNFSDRTAWSTSGEQIASFVFNPSRSPGIQYLAEATHLPAIQDASYDFVASSHCLEHVANPLRALREWHRVVRKGGGLLLVLPNPKHTFDHRRPITSIEHLREDESSGRSEEDLTHLEEVLTLHDLTRDPGAGSIQRFEERCRDNAENRCLHHHVFDLGLIRQILKETEWCVEAAEALPPMHLVAWARTSSVSVGGESDGMGI